MKILVRLPNWLGDMVMSVGFLQALPRFFPDAEVSLIAKKGIHDLLAFFPPHQHQFIFDKSIYSGLGGLKKFGKEIAATEKFDLFFSLPNSLSAATAGYFSGAEKRIGYKKELRQLLLTHSYPLPPKTPRFSKLHRVEEYVQLLEFFTGKKLLDFEPPNEPQVYLQHAFQKSDHLVVNINSEASSRRLTPEKAVSILSALRNHFSQRIYLIGAPKEKEFVDAVLARLPDKNKIESVAGKTSLPQLVELLATAQLLLTTDSGPAHLANALHTKTIVLFGAGDESRTAPYNKAFRQIIRLGKLSCEPCEKNTCVRFEVPECLEQLDSNYIIQTAKVFLLV